MQNKQQEQQKERKTDRQRQKEGKETNTSKQKMGKGDVSLVALQTQLFLSSKRNPKQKILYLLDGNASQTRIDPVESVSSTSHNFFPSDKTTGRE